MENAKKKLNKLEDLRKMYSRRSMTRNIIAYLLLTLSISILVSIYLVLNERLLDERSEPVSRTQLHYTLVELINEGQLITDSCKIGQETANILEQIHSDNKIVIEQQKNPSTLMLFLDNLTVLLISLVGFFLIQIFLKFYKFNIQLSNFYLAISDSFAIAQIEGSKITGVSFKELIKLLIPKDINLETPETPRIIQFPNPFGKKN